jgi:hypothetical protein
MASIYVSKTGTAAGDGSEKKPFATLEQARDCLRGRGTGGDPATVWIRGGDYRLEKSFELDARDGGQAGAPVVYRACPGERVRLLGGVAVGPFAPVTDPAVLKRLAPEARPHVRVTDLKAAGITNFGRLSRRGFALSAEAAHLELFFGGQPMTLAQYPAAGSFLTIADVLDGSVNEWRQKVGKPEGGFLYKDDRPRRWAPSDSIWVHGYWSWDWANSYERVETLDSEAGSVKTVAPHCVYAFKAGQRFYFLNVLEELDAPGEYYTDVQNGLLYFWPPASSAEALVSVLEEPLITVKGASHLVFQDLVLEAGRASGILVESGEDVTIGGCTVRNMGTDGIRVRGGFRHRVEGCDVSYCGDSGIGMSGGDRLTLTPADHAIVNNHIHHPARWSRTYKPAIDANGCGFRIANNRIHDGPHTAILYWGNEFTIEYNEIFRMCLETGDAGAIYTGRDYSFRGNAIRYNFIHHMGGVGMGTSAIYMDDCVSGHLIEGNIVWGGDAIWLGGGRDFVIRNNWFIDCKGAICFDSRGASPEVNWQTMVNTTMRERMEDVKAWEPPYAVRYPELASLRAYFEAGKGVPPEHNVAQSNWCVNCVLVCREEPKPGWLHREGNVEDPAPGFVDSASGNFRLTPDAKALKAGFQPPSLDRIGLVVGPFRTAERTK